MKLSTRILALLLALLTMLVMAVACSNTENDDEDDESTADKENGGESKNTPTTIEETVLLDDAALKITATEYVLNNYQGEQIKVLLENKSEKDLTVNLETLIVNDFIISNYFYEEISAGKKVNTTIDLTPYELEAAGITNVGKLEFHFQSHEPEDYLNITKYPVCTLNTSKVNDMNGTSGEGTEIYNANGVRILAKGVEDKDLNKQDIRLYIENNSTTDYQISCENFSVNGFMIDEFLYATVLSGKKAVTDLGIFPEDLEKNGIEKIENVELKFRFTDSDYENMFESELIAFTAN